MKTSRFLSALLCSLFPALALADPTITAQPVATTITAGQGGTLTVSATTTGAGPLTYQWRKFGSPLAGANGASLALSSTTLPDAGYYDVVVGDGLATVTSKSVRVDIAPAAASYGNVYRPRANAPRIEANSGNIAAIAVDPTDANKIYVAGEFTRINSTVRLNVARFLANGDFDSSWAPASIVGGGSVRALLVESDGVIIAGDFTSVGGSPRGRLAKLSKTDGSLVASFAPGTGANSVIYAIARQVLADASVRYVVGGAFTSFDGTTVNRLARVDANGVRDTAFTVSTTAGTGFNSDVRALLVDGTGASAKIYAGGLFTSHHGVATDRNRLVRLDSTGAYDSTFNVGSGFGNSVYSLAIGGTGATAKIYVGGAFTSLNGVNGNRSRLVRLDALGAYDTAFDVGTGFGSDVNALALDSAGNVYVGGAFTALNGTITNRNRLLRLTPAGAYDTAFNNGLAGANSTVNALLLREDAATPANSRLLVGGIFTSLNNTTRDGFARVATDATAALDAAPAATFRRPGTVYAIEPAPGGKWYIGGAFNSIDDQTRSCFARLNADGSLDTGFTPAGTGFNNVVYALAVQGDGRIVAGGAFNSYAGTSRADILRLNTDGTLDTAFNPGTGFNSSVTGLQLAADGRIFAVGNFTAYNGTTRNRVARLLADGALDTTFDPVAGFTAGIPTPGALALQSDGKLLVGGTFTAYNGTTANGLVRILGTGLIDTAYNTGGTGFTLNTDVRQLHTRLNDQLVAAGGFASYNGSTSNRTARLTDTGAPDAGFSPGAGANGTVTALHVQSDAKILLAGFYTSVAGVARPVFSRLAANGSLDSAFVVPTVVNPFNPINALRSDPSGNLLVGAGRLDFAEFAGRGALFVLEPAPVPTITSQPVAQIAAIGGSATFSVTATGESLAYQWRKGTAAIPGATNASLTLTNLAVSDVADYSVVVSNLYGTVASAPAALTGTAAAPTITAQPAALAALAGGGGSLSVTATGSGPLAYQWRKFGVPLAGATAATLSLSNLGLESAGYYDVVVSDGLSLRTSAGAQLTVSVPAIGSPLRPRAAFEPRVETNGQIYAFAPLSDGRFYAGGSFTTVDGVPAASLARFNADGTHDTTWTAAMIAGTVTGLAVQADGKILLAGSFIYVGGRNSFRLARLNTDGSVDTTFAVGSGFSGGAVNAIAIQSDQKILVGGAFTGFDGRTAGRIIRLNSDGTPDPAFATGAGFDAAVAALALQSDGKVVVGGGFTTFGGTAAGRIIRLNADGTRDNALVTGAGFNGNVTALALHADGRIVAGGNFATYDGAPAPGLVRLSTTGARDSGLAIGTGAPSGIIAVALQSDGKIILGGQILSFNGSTASRLVRLDGTTGAIDNSLAAPLTTNGINSTVRAVALQPGSDRILVGGSFTLVASTTRFGFARFNADGTFDSVARSFREPGQVFAIAPIPDGKFVIGGAFTHVGGVASATNLARLDASGALDSTFSIGTGPNSVVNAIARQGDGNLLVAGAFTAFSGTTVGRLVRLSADGALDSAFLAATGSGSAGQISALALSPDGRIVIGGFFTTFNGSTVNRLARLNADGTVDSAFNTANGAGFTGTSNITALVVQPDGHIVAGGVAGTFNGAPFNGLVRLLPGGGADSSFATGSGFALNTSQINGTLGIRSLVLQPDGRLLVGGVFTSYNGFAASCIARLESTGAIDHTFAIGTGFNTWVDELLLQADGSVIAAGGFSSFNGQRRGGIARLSSSGVLDQRFGLPLPTGGFPLAVGSVSFTTDGSILLGHVGRSDFIGRAAGALMLLEAAPSPSLLTLPFAGGVPAGTTTQILTASAAGTPPLSYQWKRNGTALADLVTDVTGTTTDTLRFANLQSADTGDYTLTVTDGTGATVTTPLVTLTVLAAPPALGQIVGNFGPVLQAGTAGSLNVSYAGTAPTAVTWTRNGSPVSGGFYTAGSLVFPFTPVTKADEGVYQVTATNPSGTTVSTAVRLWVSDVSNWTAHNPLPSPQGLAQLYVANNRFFATGVRGARLSSADGIAWTPLPALSQNNVYGYLEGNGRRLLIGSLGFGAISTDGNQWKTTALPTLEPVQGSAFGAGLFVVSTTFTSAPSGRSKIFTSPDGEVWTERYSTDTTALNSLAYGNGTFALFTGRSVLRSTDGITWTSHAAPATGSFVRFQNGQFFLVSSSTGDLHVSTDALTWTTRSYGATGANGLDYANNTYVLTGDNGLLLTSPDATTWTRRANNVPLTSLRYAAYNAGTWVVLSQSTFPATFLTSTDNGVTWTNRTTSVTFSDLGRIATDGTTAMVIPGNGGVILRSTDGSAWTTVASGTTDNLEGGVYGAGKYIVTGANGRILTSTDGTTWTAATSGTTQFLNDAYFLNNTFLVVGDNGTVVRSTDGTTWTAATFSTGFQCQGLAFGAGRYVAVFRGGAILTSTDAVTWTAATSGTTADLTGVAFGNGKFIIGSAGAILTSTDGLAWTSGPAPEIPNWDGGALFLNGRFYAGAYGLNGFLSSADGVTWTGHHLGYNYSDITSIGVFNGRTYLAGEFGLILSSPLVPAIAQQPANQIFAAGLPVTLRVLASGSALPITYQWRKGGEAITSATAATFTIPAATAADAGNYDVVVTTSAGSVTSQNATLTLATAPAIVTPPVAAAVIPAGGTLTLQVTVSGSAPFTFQWRKGTTPIDGATAPFYSKHGFTAADAGSYDVVISNAAGSVTSSAAAVTLAPAIGTLASDPSFTRPDFKSDALAGRATIDSLGRVYATWTNGNIISGVGNQQRGTVIRFNVDGTVDNTFNIGAALVDAWSIVLQTDGRLLVGGIASNESSETGFALPRVFRFNADGTRDFTYFSPHFAAVPRFMTMQPDGKLLVVASSNTSGNGGIPVMARLNADGSLDSTFTQPVLSAGGSVFLPPVVDGAGNIYVGGIFSTINGVSRPAVARLLATGAVDTAWVPSGFAVNGATQIRGLALQTQGANAGKLLVAGGALLVSSVNRPVVRLLSTGALDTTFTLVTQADAGMSVRPRLVNKLGDDRFYVVGSTVTRFLADGAIDTSYTKPAFSAEFFWMDTMADGRVVVCPELGATINGDPAPTLVRLTATGTVDASFAPARINREIYPGRFAVLPDSKLLTWGQFDRANATPVPGIARFHPNGSLDSGFTVTGVPDLRYIAFAEIGADGRILAGTRTGTNPTALTSGVVRLQPDGALDSSFTLDASLAGSTNGMEFRLLPDNKVSVWSLSAQGLISDSNFLRRLTATGAVDATFDPTGFGSFGSVYRGTNGAITSITLGAFRVIAHDAAGRLIARATTGSYPAGATSLTYTLLRINANGALDTTFNAPTTQWSTSVSFPTVTDAQTNGGVAAQTTANVVSGSPFSGAIPVSGGKLLVFGIFTQLGGQPAPGIARLTATGALDTTFNIGTGAQLRYQPGRTAQVEGVTVAADGKIWITGAFDTFNGVAAPGIVRLNADGTVDLGFATDIFYRTYLGGLAQVGFAPNGTVYVSGTYSRGGDTFPSAFQALVNSATPIISTQPVAAQNLAIGATATFTVAASGTDLTFQWRKDGEIIAGATNATYTINPVAVTDSGFFDVVIANGAGSVASRGSVLAVSSTVALRDQPVARRVAAGATVQFSVSATTTTAGATLTYQWRKDAAPISGATLATLQLLRVTNADAAAYSVVVSDGTNSAMSQPAGLVVTPADPVLWQQFTEFSTEQAPARTVHDGAGKVYVPWSVQDRGPDMAGGKFVGALARFDEATGALDPTFRLDRRIRGANHVVVMPDGKLLIATRVGDAGSVVRVTSTGEIDPAFTSPLFARAIRFITRQSDGKVIVVAADNLDPNAPASALGADAPAIYRLDANGALDATFTRVVVNTGVVFGPPVVDSSGRIYLAGSFNQLNGTSRYGMARLTSDGALDTAYAVVANLPAGSNYTQIRSVALQSDGRAVFVGDFRYTARGTSADRIMAVRFNTDGTFDTTFAQPLQTQLGIAASSGLRLRHLVILPDDKILAVSDRLVRLTANGAPDTSFTSRSFGKEAFWLSVGANGRLFVPDQTSIAGLATPLSTISNGIVTTLADGTPDFAFQTGGWGRIAYPTQAAVLPDGRVVIAGEFNRIGGRPVAGLAMLEANGSVSANQADPNRSHQSTSVAAAAGAQVYALIDGAANSTETGSPKLVRGLPGVSEDTAFVPVLPSGYSLSSARLYAAPGGKLLLSQPAVSVQAALAGAVGDSLIRLNVDGSRDTGYVPALSSFAVVERDGTNQVTAIKTGGLNVAQVLPDGRALVVVSAVDGNLRLLRLNADGTADTGFTPPSFGTLIGSSGFTSLLTDPVTGTSAQFPITTYSASDLIRTAVQMPDGKVYVGGRFHLTYSGAPRGLARLHANGTVDTTFANPGIAFSTGDAGPYVAKLAVDAIGRLYVAGRFDNYGGNAVPGLFRLAADGSFDASWNPGFAVLDAPRADVNLLLAGDRLHAVGTVGGAADPHPGYYRAVTLTGAPVMSPATGSGGTVVTIEGFGFTGATAVRFNGVDAPFVVTSPNRITATVPALATTGVVTVVTPGGTQTVSAAFTVIVGAKLANLSTRGFVGTGENALLANFTVEGDPKTVLLRAVGPTLGSAPFNIPGMLADPLLTVHDATGAEIARNDDWPVTLSSDFAAVGAFALGTGSKDAALKLVLAPGTYTARVTGAAATTGTALLEVYDSAGTSRLAHLGLRARAGTGADISIAGFYIAGTAPRAVLVRAIGSPLVPALGAAANPSLRIYDNTSTLVAQNDDWTASAELTAATAAAGALPLAATDAALLLSLPPGSYTAQVTSAAGSGFVLTEIHAVDAFRAESFKPALLAPLQNTSVAAGAALTLNAPVLAKPTAVSYVWKKDGTAVTSGVPVAGSPGALHLPSALTTDTGLYTVEMTNSAGTTVSAPATVAVAPPAGYSATHAVAGTGGYVAGGTVTITNTLTYVAPSQSLAWSVTLPAGWSYVSSSGEAGETRPTAGATGTIGWAWTTVPPAGSVTFTYTLAVPVGENVPRALTAFAIARPGGNPVVFVANPTPLLVAPVVAHSADTNQDFRIGLIELTRVIELFNTRNGTVRTGRYAVATTATEDGFAPDSVTAPGATVTLTRYHSADTARTATRDGKIDLIELTRVIELYNTRAGTVRTGAYRAAAGTEDGFEPIP